MARWRATKSSDFGCPGVVGSISTGRNERLTDAAKMTAADSGRGNVARLGVAFRQRARAHRLLLMREAIFVSFLPGAAAIFPAGCAQ
jgi:hypothetical protein